MASYELGIVIAIVMLGALALAAATGRLAVVFNIIGGLLLVAALWFGFRAYILFGLSADAASDPSGGFAAIFAATAFSSYAQLTMLALVGAGVFIGMAEIIRHLRRIASGTAPEAQPNPSEDGAF